MGAELADFLSSTKAETESIKLQIKDLGVKFKRSSDQKSDETAEEARSLKIKEHANLIDERVSGLQAKTARASFFLPSYELRTVVSRVRGHFWITLLFPG